MHVKILGSGQEVGKSALLVKERESKVLLDFGVKLQPEPPKYPHPPEKPDALILSHAHLDHSGAIPKLYGKWKFPAYMTDITLELSSLLIKDSMKVGKKTGFPVPYTNNDFKRMVKQTKIIRYGERFQVDNFSCELFDAGHIPGSSSVLLSGEKKVFYTGDIQTYDSQLLSGCRLPKKADVLITESTYSYKNHRRREDEIKRFIEFIDETIADEEAVLIPVFAVGRAQEILMILEKYHKYIAIDGMARKASEIIASYGSYLRNPKLLRSLLKRIHFVNRQTRTDATKKYPIIISSAGMMGGGPVINYLKEIKERPESKILFPGFLVEDSPGYNLIRTKMFSNNEEKFGVKCQIEQINLSAHTDRQGLLSIVKKLNPQNVVCIHGEFCKEFAKDIEELGIQAIAPKNGEEIKL